MKTQRISVLTALFVGTISVSADHHAIDVTSVDDLKPHHAAVKAVTFKGKPALEAQISDDARKALAEAQRQRQTNPGGGRGPGAGERGRLDHLVVVAEDFQNGTIELEVAGEPAPGATGGARGFVGVAFRVQPDMKTYDCFYLRPTNGRAEDQERRNHSAQYISHPDHPWFKLREETPGRYESYVDLVPAEWTQVKVVVEGEKARLFVHGIEQPALIINDLKSGPDGSGAVALWFEGSTVAHYANLKITK